MTDARAPGPVGPTGDGPRVTFLLIALGVVGISFSAPLVVAISAPALAVAFWRNAFGAMSSAAYVAARGRAKWLSQIRAYRAGNRTALRTAAAAGIALAVHFALWIPSLRMTTVTASTALVTTTPIWTVVLDRLRGRPVPRGVVAGVAVAMVGVLLVTGVDAGRSGRALAGDVIALLGGLAGAVYVSAGESARRSMDTASYTLVAYTVCAVLLLGICLVGRQPIAGPGYDAKTWGQLLLLTLCAQVLGHTLLNRALPAAGATTVSLAILLETPGAALVAWVWLDQQPPALIIPGAALVLAGIALVVLSRRVTNVTMTDPPPPG